MPIGFASGELKRIIIKILILWILIKIIIFITQIIIFFI